MARTISVAWLLVLPMAFGIWQLVTLLRSSSHNQLDDMPFLTHLNQDFTNQAAEYLNNLVHQVGAVGAGAGNDSINKNVFNQAREFRRQSVDNSTKEESTKPLNLVLFYADDWSYRTLGAMGNTFVQTPNLDQLAREGVLFTHNCVTTSICMVSRATLYTGQYVSTHKTFKSWANITMYEKPRWNQTLYRQLYLNGYDIGFFGKWHHIEPPPLPSFHKYAGYYGHHYHRHKGVMKHITQCAEDDGLRYLRKGRKKDKPFFLTLSFFATHAEDGSKEQYRPMNTSMWMYANQSVPLPKTFTDAHWKALPPFFNERNFGRSRAKRRYWPNDLYQHMMKNTYRMATEVDTVVGNIIKELKAQNLMDSTLIIFTTDNGNFHGHHGLAEKWYAYEESLRIPLIIRDPRMPPEAVGTKNDEFTLNIDLAPTLLTAAGLEPPAVMQGRDMAPLYTNPVEAAASWRKEFFYEWYGDRILLPSNLALVRKDKKYINWIQHGYEELFDLKNDPWEERNIIKSVDEATLTEMKTRMEELKVLAGQGVKM